MTFDDYVRTHHHEPSYQQLQALVEQAQQEQRDQQELAREQIRDIRIALGEETEKPDPKLAKTCTHLRENGQYCDSIAVKDRDFCKFHLHHRGRRLKMARARARQQRWRLQLPPLEDLYSVHVGIGLVLDALLHDQLDPRVGRLVLSGLRLAGANLARPDEAWEQPSRFQSREQLALPGFEAEFGLPAGFDLNTPPEVAFPETPAQRAAEGASGAVSEERANLMEVTPLDIELMELQQREGPEAVARRLKQAEQAEDRRYKKAQAQLAHARYVVRAAAQNAAREAQFVVRSEAAANLASSAAGKEQGAGAANSAASSGAGNEAGAASSAVASSGAGKEAGAASSGATGAPPLSAAVADRVGAGPAGRKEPRATGAPPLSAAVADRVGQGSAAAGSGRLKSK